MSPDQQINKLRKAARLSWLPKGLFILTLGLVASGFMSGVELFYVMGAFAGLAAMAAGNTAPHWRNAIAAIRSGKRSKGNVSIAITRDPTDFDRHVATVRDESARAWEFEFTPIDWQPREGDFEADIYYVRGVEWPALLLTSDGVLFPAFMPRKVTDDARSMGPSR